MIRRSYYNRAIALLRLTARDKFPAPNSEQELLDEIDRQTPKRSTTHEEHYFHFNEPNGMSVSSGAVIGGTVFLRKDGDTWWASVAKCAQGDTFSRSKGRSQARRNFFNGKIQNLGSDVTPDYDQAVKLYFGVSESTPQ